MTRNVRVAWPAATDGCYVCPPRASVVDPPSAGSDRAARKRCDRSLPLPGAQSKDALHGRTVEAKHASAGSHKGDRGWQAEAVRRGRTARFVDEGLSYAHMTTGDAGDEIGRAQVEDRETLQGHVSDLTRKAEAATRLYDRTAWIRYVAIFVPVPFVVLLFRLHMQAWHYYVAGALFLAVALVIYAMDLAAVAKRDKAIDAVQRAQEALEAARMSQRDTGSFG